MIEDLTIGEQVVLLTLDEESGTLREAPLRVSLAVSVAALLELTFAGHVVVRDGAFVPARTPAPAPKEPAAAAVAQRMRSHPEETPREWLLAVREQSLAAAYDGLSAKRLVREQGRRVLGAFGSVRHPVAEIAVLAALRERLAAVLTRGQDPDQRTAALITVLHHAGLESVLPVGADATAAERRFTAIAEGQGPAAALGETVRGAVAALVAVIAASAL
ncbi:GPP34 family phosphoprotein [Streptomyces sp. NPDC001843]|uniref:GOLPH3/VPS74 family protein n=1 Tax=Streptomyces sp. NPDC001843 TaxID=3364617 RepID=UPI0036B088F7